MKYNAEPGIIYDAIVYNTIYFCKDAMFKTIRIYTGNDEDVFRNYNEFLKTKNPQIAIATCNNSQKSND